MVDKVDTESFAKQERLSEHRGSPRDHDYLIDSRHEDPMGDQQRVRRREKRRRLLKDMITTLESEMIPDMDA